MLAGANASGLLPCYRRMHPINGTHAVATSPRVLLCCPTDRGAYIDQSQSFNVHMSDPNFGKLTSLHFYAWKKGLKTGELAVCPSAAAGLSPVMGPPGSQVGFAHVHEGCMLAAELQCGPMGYLIY